jgi:anti-sigma-K factor RskA
MTPPPKQRNLVAVLQKDAQSPAFLVSVDVDNKLMTVRPVAAEHQSGKSFELWIIHDSLGKPRSLGVVDDPSVIRPAQLAAYDKSVIESATLAISLEPEGGSPTGDPTGPVLYAGKMIEGSF